jgi:hypothetical protein
MSGSKKGPPPVFEVRQLEAVLIVYLQQVKRTFGLKQL